MFVNTLIVSYALGINFGDCRSMTWASRMGGIWRMCVRTHASADLHMAVFSSGTGILKTDNCASNCKLIVILINSFAESVHFVSLTSCNLENFI